MVILGVGITTFFIKLYRVRWYFMRLQKQGLVSFCSMPINYMLMTKGNAPIPPPLRTHEVDDQPGI